MSDSTVSPEEVVASSKFVCFVMPLRLLDSTRKATHNGQFKDLGYQRSHQTMTGYEPGNEFKSSACRKDSAQYVAAREYTTAEAIVYVKTC